MTAPKDSGRKRSSRKASTKGSKRNAAAQKRAPRKRAKARRSASRSRPSTSKGGQVGGGDDGTTRAGASSGLPDIQPTCDGLIIQVGVPGQSEDAGLTVAQAVVSGVLRGQWVVASLGPGSDAFEVTRARKDKDIRLSTAWSHTYRLRAHRDVRTAEASLTVPGHDLPDALVAAFLTPEESLTAQSRLTGDKPKACARNDFEWSIKLCEIDKALELPLPPGGKHGGAGIVIGHPDTGYTTHPEIWDITPSRRRILPGKGYDFSDGDSDATDRLQEGFLRQPGHGTATSSVIMSSKDPAGPSGVTGVATKARLIPIRVTPTVILFSFSKLAKALYHAVANTAHALSISLGRPLHSATLQLALQYPHP